MSGKEYFDVNPQIAANKNKGEKCSTLNMNNSRGLKVGISSRGKMLGVTIALFIIENTLHIPSQSCLDTPLLSTQGINALLICLLPPASFCIVVKYL